MNNIRLMEPPSLEEKTYDEDGKEEKDDKLKKEGRQGRT